ncbi:MAG: hypothetical protein IT285_06010 [Bdellovibrionales bacterium]|nr:hypothetical protein [Bdellovibrionales bacterium]
MRLWPGEGLAALLLGIAAVLPAQAGPYDGLPCPPATPSVLSTEEIRTLEAAISGLSWWPVTIWADATAPCRPEVPDKAGMRTWLTDTFASGSPAVTRTVHGVLLENQPEALVDLFARLTTTHASEGADQVTPAVPADCHEFFCAARAALGADIADQLAYLLARHHLNGSHLAGPSITGPRGLAAFRSAELSTILRAAADLPPHLLGIEPEISINHATRDTSSGTTVANARITLFDKWSNELPHNRNATVVHELGHRVGSSLNLDESPGWLALAGWEQRTYLTEDGNSRNTWLPTRPGCLISGYAATNPSEDFAESVVAYRYVPDELEARCPEKYRYMKELVFDGIEYGTDAECASPARLSTQVQTAVAGRLETLLGSANAGSETGSRGALRSCREQLMSFYAARGLAASPLSGEARGCLASSLAANAALGPPPVGLDGITNRDEYLRVMSRIGAPSNLVTERSDELTRAARGAMRDALLGPLRYMFSSSNPLAGYDYQYRSNTPRAEFCARETRHADQTIQRMVPTLARNDGEYDLFFFRNATALNGWFHAACMRMQPHEGRIVAPTEADIASALDSVLAAPGGSP